MEYNLAGIRQRILVDKLDDDEFDPQIVDNFINDTQRDIFNQFELPFQEKIFEGTIQSGSTMLQMPEDLALLQAQKEKLEEWLVDNPAPEQESPEGATTIPV